MTIAVVTGSAGLIGAEAVGRLVEEGMEVVGVDNDMRSFYFGAEASTQWSRERLERSYPSYRHTDADIRDFSALEKIFAHHGTSIELVIHTAAQPSHDWAAKDPQTDFTVNANGTLNLLELTRRYCPEAVFIFTSTNKVYGDRPNQLPLVERETRWELDPAHHFAKHGIDETMSVDGTLHSLFGASKLAGDVIVQEYGRYFGMKTVCFRGGCLTGPGHSGTQLHGFLAYLIKCAVTATPYTVIGYKGKQVRDNIHSKDLIEAFWQVFRAPRVAEVYNIGGGRFANCSILESIALCEELTGRPMDWDYAESNRTGDHIWWISDIQKFQSHYPKWRLRYDIELIVREIHEQFSDRFARAS